MWLYSLITYLLLRNNIFWEFDWWRLIFLYFFDFLCIWDLFFYWISLKVSPSLFHLYISSKAIRHWLLLLMDKLRLFHLLDHFNRFLCLKNCLWNGINRLWRQISLDNWLYQLFWFRLIESTVLHIHDILHCLIFITLLILCRDLLLFYLLRCLIFIFFSMPNHYWLKIHMILMLLVQILMALNSLF